ncbi:MAG: lipopolysaccharide kinase InaA family protein [Candidatus Binatia bacterium]
MRLDSSVGPADWLRVGTTAEAGRRSRHARTAPSVHAGARYWVKAYPAPDGHRAWRAARMMAALDGAGFAAPEVILVGTSRGAGLLATRDVGGRGLLEATAEGGTPRREKWRRLRSLGIALAALHRAGFVPGDLVPSNVHLRGDQFVFLDHDRTRRSRVLVWWHGRRNLVQLGRFVVAGIGITDRARVLRAYADGRGLPRRARRRLARWVVAKTMERRCAIDRIPPDVARRAGFTALMRSGGPFDPARVPSGGDR